MSRQPPLMRNIDVYDTQQRIDKLTVVKLKEVARSIGLALSGRKLDIQERIKLFFDNGVRSNDVVRLLTIRTLVLKASSDQLLPNYQMLYISIQTNSYLYDVTEAAVTGGTMSGSIAPSLTTKSHTDTARPWLYFKESPFYRLKRLLNGTPILAHKAPESRGSCSVSFVLNESESALLASGSQFHLLLLSGAYNGIPSQEALIEFPQPLEIHFNGTLVKDNVKGIKNKPGTARPADLTKYLKMAPSQNKLDLIYAFAKTDYLLFCYIVEMLSPEIVLEKIFYQPHILKLSTLKEFQKEQDDEDDLLEMQEVLTLRCPLTYARMKYPAKSLYCKHIQCFDALSFLQLQEQASTWSCPICQKSVTVKTLAIDDFLSEVLQNTSEDDEAIELDHSGKWTVKKKDEINSNNHGQNSVNNSKPIDTETIAFNGKLEDSTPTLPKETSANAPDAIEIISLDSDSDEEEEEDGMDELVMELEREVSNDIVPETDTNLPVEIDDVEEIIDDDPISNISVEIDDDDDIGANRGETPLPPPLEPPPTDAISATSSMIQILASAKENGESHRGRDIEVDPLLATQVDDVPHQEPLAVTNAPPKLPSIQELESHPPEASPQLSAPTIEPSQTENVPANPQASTNPIPPNNTQTPTNGERLSRLPSFASQLPSWSQQTLLRPMIEGSSPRSIPSFSPSRFVPSLSQQSPRIPQPQLQLYLPIDDQRRNSTQSLSQPKRVNLGFSLSRDIVPTLERHLDGSSSIDNSGNLSSPNNTFGSIVNHTENDASPKVNENNSMTHQVANVSNLRRSPSRFVAPFLLPLPQASSPVVQLNSSTPSKRPLDVLHLEDDDENTPLAKR